MVSVSLQDIHQLINRYQLINSHLPHYPLLWELACSDLNDLEPFFRTMQNSTSVFPPLLTSWVICGVSSWCKDNVFDKNSLLFPGSQNESSSLAWGNHWSASPNQICVKEVLHKHLKGVYRSMLCLLSFQQKFFVEIQVFTHLLKMQIY